MSADRKILPIEVPPRPMTAAVLSLKALRGQGLRLVAPLGRPCVAGDHGHCLACGALQGEPCRQPSRP